MKKILLMALLACPAMGAFAEPQFIITDCGTRHQVADNATPEEIIDAIDRYSKEDCK